jgi:putative flavoprotein involved in K+ transport
LRHCVSDNSPDAPTRELQHLDVDARASTPTEEEGRRVKEESVLVANWVAEFAAALKSGRVGDAVDLFHDDSYWRDLVLLTWNIVTVEGREGVRELLDSTLDRAQPSNFRLVEDLPPTPAPVGTVQGWFKFETEVARGRGLVRLRDGKAWTLLTAIDEFIGFEEPAGERRPLGAGHGVRRDRTTWLEDRERENADFEALREPYTLIVGGGQGGIGLAARLRQLGVPTLIVDSRARPGDAWRSRYKTLCLHDPVWYDHLPYLHFPATWPIYTPKDKIADWLEMYAKVMELAYWESTTCRSASWNEQRCRWDVVVNRGDEDVVLHPTQLVIATGLSGGAHLPMIPGQEAFAGEQQHSSQHTGEGDYEGKNVVVVGANNSAHDIAAALWEAGANVTMLQRSSTLVVTADSLRRLQAGLYSEAALAAGITVDHADLLQAAVPYRLVPSMSIPAWDRIRETDAALYDALERAGFMLDFGTDGSGLGMKYLTRAGGYYVNVGASELVAAGEIGLRSGVSIDRLSTTGVVLSTSEELDADLVVYATGFGPMSDTIADLTSEEVAREVGPIWGLGSDRPGDPGPWEGELRNVWKPTKKQGLWIHAGNLQQSRVYSRYLALQIKARYEGIPASVYVPSATAAGAIERAPAGQPA